MSTEATKLVSFPAPERVESDRKFTQRWGGKPDVFARGYLPVPSHFLELYATLNMTTGEALFFLHVMDHKWDSKLPFPSYKTLAKRMDVSDKMVRNHALSLEIKGLLRRKFLVGRPNRFDFTPLFEALQAAIEKQAEQKTKKKSGANQKVSAAKRKPAMRP